MVSLNKPTEGDTDWATPVNDNWSTIESSLVLAGLCQGRLTLDSTASVMTSNRTGANAQTLYLVRHKGSGVGLHDGSTWNAHEIPSAGVSASLSGLTAGNVYDVFLYDNSGTLTLDLVAWTAHGAGSSTRTALGAQDGVLVKASATSHLFVGTIMIDPSTTGQSIWDDQNRLVWNMFNRHPVFMRELATSSWTNTGNRTWSAWSSGVGTWDFRFVVGLVEDTVFAQANAVAQSATSNTAGYIGVGLNSATTRATDCQGGAAIVASSTWNSSMTASWEGFGALGFNEVRPLNTTDGTVQVTFNGYAMPTYGPAGFMARVHA